jgi:hypothetical protein
MRRDGRYDATVTTEFGKGNFKGCTSRLLCLYEDQLSGMTDNHNLPLSIAIVRGSDLRSFYTELNVNRGRHKIGMGASRAYQAG